MEERIKIPSQIDPDELLLRAIFHPLFVTSKKKLKKEAMMPPPAKDGKSSGNVSIFREKYSTSEKVKMNASKIKMSNNTLTGFAVFTEGKLEKIKDMVKMNDDMSDFRIVFGPIDKTNAYRKDKDNVFADDEGIPCHADVVYNQELVAGTGNSEIKKTANEIVKLLEYKENPDDKDSSFIKNI
jgi:hypothetical protein